MRNFIRQVYRDVFGKSLIVALVFYMSLGTSFSQDKPQALTISDYKKLSLEELMDMEVTSASKMPEKLNESASAIQVITAEDIRLSGATTVPEALRLAPNLQVAQVNASQWAISARGFNNVLANKLLVLIDGRTVYTPLYSGVYWDVQNLILEDIERIEVVSGPGGTLWGANAVNGVINIITKSAKDTKGLYAEALAGTELKGLASLRYGGTISEEVSYKVYGTTFKRDNTIFQDSVDAADDWQMAQGGGRLDWTPNKKNSLLLLGNYLNGRPDPDGDAPVEAKGSNLLARWNRTFSENSNLQLQMYYDQTWRDFRNDFTERLKTYDLEVQHHLSLTAHHDIVYGGGFRAMKHNVENLELFAFVPAKKSLYLFNLFLQDNIEIVPEKLKLIAGIKIEHYTYSEFQFQPNVRVSWTPSVSNTLWTAVSRAVRNPSRIDREFTLSLAPGLPFIVGNDAEPEELLAYEFGWHTRLAKSLSIGLAAFYNQYDKIRGVEPARPDSPIPLVFTNTVEGDSYGAELSFAYQISNSWRIRGGYNYFQKDLRVKAGRSDSNNASAESNDPSHQAILQSLLAIGKKIDLGFVMRYVGALPDPQVDDYVGLDIRFAYRPVEKIELSIAGQNLMQESHLEFIPNSPEPKEIERNLYFKIAARL